MDGDPWLSLIIVIVLLLLNAMFAAAEIAVIELNEAKLKKQAKEGSKKAGILLKMKEQPSNFLSTIQIGITIAGLLNGAVASDAFAEKIVSLFENAGTPAVYLGAIEALAMIAVTLVLTYFTIVFGELVPKRIGMQKSEKFAMKTVGMINMLSKIARPFVWLLTKSTNGILRLFGIDPNDDGETVTEDEIMLMVQEGNEQGHIHDTEVEFISNMFEFGDLKAEDIMTHRTEIIGIPVTSSVKEISDLIADTTHGTYPVYDGTIDKIVGMFYVQDAGRLLRDDVQNKLVSDFMRHAFYVPGTKPVIELLEEMKKTGNKMAVVVDEYGGTEGIVTIMDIIEEIVGDIEDSPEEDEPVIMNDGSYVLDGLTEMEDVIELLGLEMEDDEYDTLSGFVIDHLGFVPQEDETPEITELGYVFKIVKMAGSRAESILIKEAKE